MRDVFALVTHSLHGLQVMSLEEWVREHFLAAQIAAAREDLRRQMDDDGLSRKHPLRTELSEGLESAINRCCQQACDAIERIAKGRSLDELGRVLGVPLVRAPGFDLGEPSLQTFAEVRALQIVHALAGWCRTKQLSRSDARATLEAAKAPIMELVREATEAERQRRIERAV